jgi:hypothetical protein
LEYFGLEIYDGRSYQSKFALDENKSLEEQWFFLDQDILCIDYNFNGFQFSVDVGWYPEACVTPDSFFRTEVIEGPRTEGGRFFTRFSTDIKQLKFDIQEAINLIQKFKSMRPEDVIQNKIPEHLLKWSPK